LNAGAPVGVSFVECSRFQKVDYRLSSLEDLAAVAPFVPRLPSYVPEGIHPFEAVYVRGGKKFSEIASGGLARRQRTPEAVRVEYRGSPGVWLTITLDVGFVPDRYYVQAPEDMKGRIILGETEAFWLSTTDGTFVSWSEGGVQGKSLLKRT